MTNKPFEGLIVLELSAVLAGPAVGMFFAELGAQVIKIENLRTGGDMTRKWKAKGEDPNSSISAYYSAVNYNKEVRMRDLSRTEAQQEIHDLVPTVDVVISNFKPGAAEAFHCDYNTFKSLNNKTIYAHISGFGLNNSRPAFDVVVQAESGFMHMNGTPESGPTKMPVALMDVLAAHQLKEGILVALLEREKTGVGAFVTTSLFQSAISSLANQATNYLMNDLVPNRIGSLHPNIAPYGETFTCADGLEIVLAVGTDRQFAGLCEVLGQSNLASDVRFASNPSRVANRADLAIQLSNAIGRHKRDALLNALLEKTVPAGAIRDLKAVFEQKEAQEMVLHSEMEDRHTSRVRTAAFDIVAFSE